MISQTVEYALRAIVTLAQHNGTPCTAQQLSEITGVPGPYLSKLMQQLVRAGLVRSQRGLHGGFVLTKAPDELCMFDVVDAVEPMKRIHECPLKLGDHSENLCPLHRRLDNAMAMVEQMFRQTTLTQLLDEPGSVTPLCGREELERTGAGPRPRPRAKDKAAAESGTAQQPDEGEEPKAAEQPSSGEPPTVHDGSS